MIRDMLRLHFFHRGDKMFGYATDKIRILIGRGSKCDIQLSDPCFSREHCCLHLKNKDWILENLSSNGIIDEISQNIIHKIKVVNKSRIRLNRAYSMEVETLPVLPEPSEKTLVTKENATQIISVNSNSQNIVLGKAQILSIDSRGQAICKDLSQTSICLGNHEANDIVLNSKNVSQFHARIDFIHNRFRLTDLDSTNGTFVNDIRATQVDLPAQAKIQIGSHELQFCIKETEIPLPSSTSDCFMGLLSRDKKMKRLFSMAETLAETLAPVFIQGETGTGKELLAKAIHRLSDRAAGPFIAINCATLPKELIESELFGHEKGAFTGAHTARVGAFEAAHHGTLFLDEIGELELPLQAKLLRALEGGEIKKVGSSIPIQTSVRIISATHQDLKYRINQGDFREDLYFRLVVVPLTLPPLRERISDLDILIPHFLKEMNWNIKIEPAVYIALKKYSFPGNIRELKNILQRARAEYHLQETHDTSSGILQLKYFHFLKDISLYRQPSTANQKMEKATMKRLLEAHRFNQSKVAKIMKLPISTFHDKLRRYGIYRPKIRIG